ncbi:metal transporter [Shewanella sp. NIFS-20-20]|uniref:metal transporter n=1 Tax=Shewanella sp. NIFS-20-20 TaxID=2853806 RepID=UPI001C473CB0|nr:metal transporter [Shewanella sp. NIFS-20-20]MBV7316052.1 metal transporter [Shewanella sp. NIFS-20-20]
MLYLVASCLALLLGPLFYRYFTSGSGLHKGLDGFIFVSLGGLVLIHILPELLEHGGLLSLLFVMLGLWGPTASEKVFHRWSNMTHNLTLVLGIGGLLLHTITDGGAMVLAQQQDASPLLALGVVLHRLPVGLAIWWLLKPQVGNRWAAVVIAAMMVLTGVGYFAGGQLLQHLSLDNTVYLQAFVTGSILHVVLHQPHGQSEHDTKGKYQYQAGIGSLLGVGLLVLLLTLDSGAHSHHHHDHSTDQLFYWLTSIAPILLLAYACASLRFVFGIRPNTSTLSSLWLQRLAGPEALIITLFLLGPAMTLIQAGALLGLGALLSYWQIQPVQPHKNIPAQSIQFGFVHLVDRSAPWIIFCLILANLIGHPSVPLNHPLLQLALLTMVFIPSRFCNLAGAVLAVALANSGWSNLAVLFALIAAPIVNRAQLMSITWLQRAILVACLASVLLIAHSVNIQWQPWIHLPESINLIALGMVALLFAGSLLRVGPRGVMKRLMLDKVKISHHHDSHHHH